MKLIEPSYKILTDLLNPFELIESAARTCYKSEAKKKDEESSKAFVKRLIRSGHLAMIEHSQLSLRFITDRGVSHEIVRHRHFSFAQESTRYCNYSKDKFGNELTFIRPFWYDGASYNDQMIFNEQLRGIEKVYNYMIDSGRTPQEARAILPNCIKTEIVVTGNFREWKHFLNLRAANATGNAHPDMNRLVCPLLLELHESIPVIFDDEYERMLDNVQAAKYIESFKID